MKVELIDYQENALDLLIYTKSTRLAAGQGLSDIASWSVERKLEHLEYMRHTIKSSWEFVRYIFRISEVSRVFTHQLVRTRTQSYAQESQRTVDVHENGFYFPPFKHGGFDPYYNAVLESVDTYVQLTELGEDNQDARYVLPEGTLTSIIVGTDLRTLHQTAETRLCKRTAGEYQEVFKAIKAEVIKVHPWAEKFIQVACVNTGICIFPNYKECPVQPHTIKVTDTFLDFVKQIWEENDHVANPVAKDGKTM